MTGLREHREGQLTFWELPGLRRELRGASGAGIFLEFGRKILENPKKFMEISMIFLLISMNG